MIGGNDAANVLLSSSFQMSGTIPSNFVSRVVSRITDRLDELAAAGSVREILATVPRRHSHARGAGILQRVAVAADARCAGHDQPSNCSRWQARAIPVIDLFAMMRDVAAVPPLVLAGVSTSDLFGPDGFHPSPLLHGLVANTVVGAANAGAPDDRPDLL